MTRITDHSTQLAHQAWIEEPDPRLAIDTLRADLDGQQPSAVIIYPTPGYDLPALAAAMRDAFTCPVLACSSAGVLHSDHGYIQHGQGIVASAILTPRFQARLHLIEDIKRFNFDQANRLYEQMNLPAAEGVQKTRFGMLLIDAMAFCEDRVTALLHGATRLPIVGGSAGNAPDQTKTYVFDGQDFRDNIAVFAVITTDLPCRLMRHQHFHAGGERLVVTEADPDNRRIISLNAEPAAELYRRMIGVDELTPGAYAPRPLLLQCHGQSFARAVRCANDDDSLSIYAGIEEGMIIRIGQAEDMIQSLQQELRQLDETLGGIALIHAFDCILRRSECDAHQQHEAFRQAIAPYGLLGFNTFGEQCDGLNLNQTLTGFALGHG